VHEILVISAKSGTFPLRITHYVFYRAKLIEQRRTIPEIAPFSAQTMLSRPFPFGIFSRTSRCGRVIFSDLRTSNFHYQRIDSMITNRN